MIEVKTLMTNVKMMHRKMIYFEKSQCYISLRNNHSGEKKGSVDMCEVV